MDKIRLQSNGLCADFHARQGVLESLRMIKDDLGTECAGNAHVISYPSILEMNQWIGDWKIRVWDEKRGDWTEELTSASIDIRKVFFDKEKNEVIIEYPGASHRTKGIKNIALNQKFVLNGDVLSWDVTVKNITESPIELGEMSAAFVTNSDFTGVFEDAAHIEEERWRGWKQKIWHEQRVQRHLSINGSSSYALLQRPKGDYPVLLFQTVEGTGIEAAYQMDTSIGCQWSCTFEGPYYLSLYSKAARKCGRWTESSEVQRYWLNGNSSRMLDVGESFDVHFAFRVLYSEDELKIALYEAGQVAVDVQPGMVVPVGETLQMRLHCKDKISLVRLSNNIEILQQKQDGDFFWCSLLFKDMGQKKICLNHGNGKTNLFFYSVGNPEKLLKAHANFVATRQYYENPDDPYHRHHAFLPFDDSLETLFTESEESWQVGALDEYAFPVAMYLAEKNIWMPEENEIAILEEYIDDCLYGILQQKETYYARRGMYYEERTPSDIFEGNKWDKDTAESILRSFNYPLIMDIYFAMYQIGSKNGMLKRRTAEQYLEMAYRTAMVGYDLGRNKFNGAPAGATIVDLLDALYKEKPEWYSQLNEKVSWIAGENAKSEYPFGSELYVDQTAHNQYQAMMKYFNFKERMDEAYRVTYALRAGMQPAWFLYGNEKRGNVCCWYGTPLNSRVLFDGYDENGNINYLKMGYAGLFSFLTCIRSNGAAHGWFLWWPDRTGFDQRSLDTDMGMYGYLKSAKSYVVNDPVFGVCGYGCHVEKIGETLHVVPYDGVGLRFRAVPYGLDIVSQKGKICELWIDEEKKCCTVRTDAKKLELKVQKNVDWQVCCSDAVIRFV